MTVLTSNDDIRTERERIEDWRLLKLMEAGYSELTAGKIAARHDIDLHYAIELVSARGCCHALAADILL